MLLQIAFRKKATWRTARSITLAARSAKHLRVADPCAIYPETGENEATMADSPRIFHLFTRRRQRKHVGPRSRFTFMQNTPIYSRNKPLHCYHGGYTHRPISWLSLLVLRRIPRGKWVGSLVLFSKPVLTIHGVFAPEVTVESYQFKVRLWVTAHST